MSGDGRDPVLPIDPFFYFSKVYTPWAQEDGSKGTLLWGEVYTLTSTCSSSESTHDFPGIDQILGSHGSVLRCTAARISMLQLPYPALPRRVVLLREENLLILHAERLRCLRPLSLRTQLALTLDLLSLGMHLLPRVL